MWMLAFQVARARLLAGDRVASDACLVTVSSFLSAELSQPPPARIR
jgi:hypothetical protein